jgi:hypothetical protein
MIAPRDSWMMPPPCNEMIPPGARHLDIVDYYEGHGQGFDHYCAWLDERGYHDEGVQGVLKGQRRLG